ncbi:MAG: YkgB family protein [Flammeovirgaceae bacterium]|nr:YkgB family protein [Flammeovirgaceae bacterium]
MKKVNFNNLGYIISVSGVIVVLLWIGIFKFTPTEAKAIEPLVKNSFLMSWLYRITSVQGVSNLIGTIEIITAIALSLHFFWKKAGLIGGFLAAGTFLITLSFLATTPGVFSAVDGVPVTEFFILKDIMALGISLLVVGKSLPGDDEGKGN